MDVGRFFVSTLFLWPQTPVQIVVQVLRQIRQGIPADGTAAQGHQPAGTYTLCETKAPEGYEVAADIVFQVTGDGKLLINEKAVDGLTVTMTDKRSRPRHLLRS